MDYKLTGYVKNLSDFEYVEVEFQGEPTNINKAIAKINSKLRNSF
jgi:acylphosphatase